MLHFVLSDRRSEPIITFQTSEFCI